MSAPPVENGPWYATEWFDGRVVIQSDDFTHDVALIVTGDFEDDEQRKAYARMIAERLSAATVPAKEE
jgi:hypothetical protein